MRLHTIANEADVYAAARLARVDLVTLTRHGSRKADHAFEVKLEGESRRRPNGGSSGAGSDYAATWDQWGVFLGYLFDVDPALSCWAYVGADNFHHRTDWRFEDGWPEDAHGDHRFRFDGMPGEQSCVKCSAVTRWEMWARVDADDRGEGDGYAEPRDEMDEMPLEIVWEIGEPFAVVLGTGGPHAEITGGGRSGGYVLTVYWAGDRASVSGAAITRTGEHFREMVEGQ